MRSPRVGGHRMYAPKAKSEAEETLDLQLRAHGIDFEREVPLIAGRKWRWDFVIGTLAIEIHGGIWVHGAHSRGSGQERDFEKQNEAVLAGYRTLAFSSAMVKDGSAIDVILRAIA